MVYDHCGECPKKYNCPFASIERETRIIACPYLPISPSLSIRAYRVRKAEEVEWERKLQLTSKCHIEALELLHPLPKYALQ